MAPRTEAGPPSLCRNNGERRASFFREPAAFPPNSSPFIGRQRYTMDGQSAIRPKGCAQASRVIVRTRPLPLLGAFDQAGPHWVEMNVLHFLVIFLNRSQSAVEKSRLPEKAPLSSARIDGKRRARLDRFHYTPDGDGETGEYDRMPRRGGIAKEGTGGERKAEGRKCTAESGSSPFWPLTSSLSNPRRRKPDMRGDYTPHCRCTSCRVSEKRDCASSYPLAHT